jgi:hypothetical protein
MKGEKFFWEKLKKANKTGWDDGSLISIRGKTTSSLARLVISRSLLQKYNPNAKFVAVFYRKGYLGLRLLENETESDCYVLKDDSKNRKAINCKMMRKFFPLKYFEKDINYDEKNNIIFVRAELNKEEEISIDDISDKEKTLIPFKFKEKNIK